MQPAACRHFLPLFRPAAESSVPEVKRALYEAVTADKVSSTRLSRAPLPLPAPRAAARRGLFCYCTQVAVQHRHTHFSLGQAGSSLFFAPALFLRQPTGSFPTLRRRYALYLKAFASGSKAVSRTLPLLLSFSPSFSLENSPLECKRSGPYACEWTTRRGEDFVVLDMASLSQLSPLCGS